MCFAFLLAEYNAIKWFLLFALIKNPLTPERIFFELICEIYSRYKLFFLIRIVSNSSGFKVIFDHLIIFSKDSFLPIPLSFLFSEILKLYPNSLQVSFHAKK